MTVWRLEANTEYWTIAALFGVGCSNVCKIVLETCEMIAHYLLSWYITVSPKQLLQDIVDGFDSCWGFSQAFGAIDSTHILILRPQKKFSRLLQQEKLPLRINAVIG